MPDFAPADQERALKACGCATCELVAAGGTAARCPRAGRIATALAEQREEMRENFKRTVENLAAAIRQGDADV